MLSYLTTINRKEYTENKSVFEGSLQGINDISGISRLVFISDSATQLHGSDYNFVEIALANNIPNEGTIDINAYAGFVISDKEYTENTPFVVDFYFTSGKPNENKNGKQLTFSTFGIGVEDSSLISSGTFIYEGNNIKSELFIANIGGDVETIDIYFE